MSIVSRQRKHLDRIIKRDSTSIVIERPEYESDGAGGYTGSREELAPQIVSVIQRASGGPAWTMREEGQVKQNNWIIRARHTADLKREDMFTIESGGTEYRLRIERVVPVEINGELIGYYCEASDVSTGTV